MKSLITLLILLLSISALRAQSSNFNDCNEFSILPSQLSYNVGDSIPIGIWSSWEYMEVTQNGVSTNPSTNINGIVLSGGSVEHHLTYNNLVRSYGIYSSNLASANHVLTIDGNIQFSLDTVFPLALNGYTVNLEVQNVANSTVQFGYLLIQGYSSSLEISSSDLGILSYCVMGDQMQVECNDFTDTIEFQNSTYLNGDTILNNTAIDNIMTITSQGAAVTNGNSNDPGIYVVDDELVFTLNGIVQLDMYYYGFAGQYGQSYLKLNSNGPQIPLDTVFPLFINNRIITLDQSIPDFGNWEVSKISIYGWTDTLYFQGFEAGITNICSVRSLFYISTDEVIQEEIDVFPNPTTGILKIKGLTNDDTLVLYNAQGQELMYTSKNQLDLTELDEGIYFLHILKEDGTSMVKRVLKL